MWRATARLALLRKGLGRDLRDKIVAEVEAPARELIRARMRAFVRCHFVLVGWYTWHGGLRGPRRKVQATARRVLMQRVFCRECLHFRRLTSDLYAGGEERMLGRQDRIRLWKVLLHAATRAA
jgi:hypothetical protein